MSEIDGTQDSPVSNQIIMPTIASIDISRPYVPTPYTFTPAESGLAVSLGADPVVELPGELEAPESAGAFAAGVSSGVSPTPDSDGVVVADGVPSVVVELAADVDDVPAELLLLPLLATALAANPVYIISFLVSKGILYKFQP